MNFTLREMLFVMFAISVLLALVFAGPSEVGVAVLLLMTSHSAAFAAVGIIYFDGDIRAFSIGVAVAFSNVFVLNFVYSSSMILERATAFITGVTDPSNVDEMMMGKLMLGYSLSICLTSGLLCVIGRRLSERLRRRANAEQLDSGEVDDNESKQHDSP